jgi:ribosomal protein S6--L-glutamate ligase
VLAEVMRLLSVRHATCLLDTSSASLLRSQLEDELPSPADLYLLKAHSEHALESAASLESAGSLVVNEVAATRACQDRAHIGRMLGAMHVTAPVMLGSGALGEVARTLAADGRFPLVVKSRQSRRGDLVTIASTEHELTALLPAWSTEDVVVQEYVPNDGWDLKLWVVGSRVFAARRPSPLAQVDERPTLPVADVDVPHDVVRDVLQVGAAFRLDVYGVDVVWGSHGPVVVDVNAFPGCRGVPGAALALAGWVESHAPARSVPA